MNDRDHQAFSFAKSAKTKGLTLITDLIEAKVRLPLNDEEHPYYEVEKTAQKALGLSDNSPFLVIERGRLLLPLNDEEHPFNEVEKSALNALKKHLKQRATEKPFNKVEKTALEELGLSENSPLRARLLDNQPSALHRVFLDPVRFPPNFLDCHNLKEESLISIYEQYGFKLVSRDTVLVARGTNTYESSRINQRYHKDPHGRVVLDAEQRLYAQDPKTGNIFVLEFLKASYLDDWKYEIKNRPA